MNTYPNANPFIKNGILCPPLYRCSGARKCELKTIPQVYIGDILPVDGDVAWELDTGVGGVSYSYIII